MESYKVLGLMSGTSLDGLDMAICEFSFENIWRFKILEGRTISYSDEFRKKLSDAPTIGGLELIRFHKAYGKYCGDKASAFLNECGISCDFIASHGHTVFHQPSLSYTFQLGDGASLAAASSFAVVSDFRSLDVALGGQGAPLVPIGDRLLFSEYEYCVNLGGIANISFEKEGKRIAFDICACNLLLNHLSVKAGLIYDEGGGIAASGKVHDLLLKQMNASGYFLRSFPKSLGREDVERDFLQAIEKNEFGLPLNDLMATCVEHVAIQIGRELKKGRALLSGGGAFNKYLLERIRKHSDAEIVLPSDLIINYKEALIFAFLGVLRWRGEVNTLKSVTGASSDSCGGSIYLSS